MIAGSALERNAWFHWRILFYLTSRIALRLTGCSNTLLRVGWLRPGSVIFARRTYAWKVGTLSSNASSTRCDQVRWETFQILQRRLKTRQHSMSPSLRMPNCPHAYIWRCQGNGCIGMGSIWRETRHHYAKFSRRRLFNEVESSSMSICYSQYQLSGGPVITTGYVCQHHLHTVWWTPVPHASNFVSWLSLCSALDRQARL